MPLLTSSGFVDLLHRLGDAILMRLLQLLLLFQVGFDGGSFLHMFLLLATRLFLLFLPLQVSRRSLSLSGPFSLLSIRLRFRRLLLSQPSRLLVPCSVSLLLATLFCPTLFFFPVSTWRGIVGGRIGGAMSVSAIRTPVGCGCGKLLDVQFVHPHLARAIAGVDGYTALCARTLDRDSSPML